MWDQLNYSCPLHNREVEFHVSRILLKVVEECLVWGAQDVMDLVHLVHLIISWEERE
jgi:hypothetical protein